MKNPLRYIKIILPIILIILLSESCQKDVTPPKNTVVSELDLHINNFIWEDMSAFYLWNVNVNSLNPSIYNSQADLDKFLKTNADHEKFFNSLLYNKDKVDRFSFIVDDYTQLENMFQGISTSPGFDFRLAFDRNKKIFGIVRFVTKGSPADKMHIKRGDVFTRVNGSQITEANYQTLLSDTAKYDLGMAHISNYQAIDDNNTIHVVFEEVHENPVFFDSIYYSGGKTIGYLVYNQFVENYSNQLNAVFRKFKTQGVQKLILDLRYNPGGALQTATYLASMIYKADPNKVFVKTMYNTELQKYMEDKYTADSLNTKFETSIAAEPNINVSAEPIESLGLTSLCVITTNGTASASEILINGLEAYIPVTIIGDTTYGKFVGSVTFKDVDKNGIVNSKHKWAIQPIIMKSANNNGVTGPTTGLVPDHFEYEDFTNLRPLGDLTETLLNAAINYVTYGTLKKSAQVTLLENFKERNDLIPHKQEMYLKSVPKIR